jgi:GNAT superfamily N-acetyltransferase
MHDYERTDNFIMLLTGNLQGVAKPHEIRTVETADDWNAFADLVEIEEAERDGDNPRERRPGDREFIASKRAICPSVRYWMAYVDDHPRAYFYSWTNDEGIGAVDDLFTHPDYPHCGLAMALMYRCVADCRERGAGPAAITANGSDTPKRMYAAMGFRPIAVDTEYAKDVD